MRLVKMLELSTEMRCETGLSIGGSKDTIEIGGIDNPIIKHPLTGLPYVPGSSLKGKLRSLLENVNGRFVAEFDRNTRQVNIRPQRNGEPCGCGQRSCKVCKLFGPHKNTRHDLGPTRIIVRDASLTVQSESVLREALDNALELKYENQINRDTGVATNPRPFERVPAGIAFNVSIVLRVYEGDDENDLKATVLQAMHLLENDYLGRSGSRGYGKVKFLNTAWHDIDVAGTLTLSS